MTAAADGSGAATFRPTSFALYGLTPEVERAVDLALQEDRLDDVEALIKPLHAADLADLLERQDRDDRRQLATLLATDFDPLVLSYLDETVRDEVMMAIEDGDLAKAVAHARRQSSSGLLVVIDLDQFKAINDAHGHLAGDAMLIAVAKVLNAFVRETDTVARLGGDEFAILMPSADLLEGQKRINFLEAQLNSKTVQHGQAQLQIKASVGCQTYQGYETEDALLNAADKVMYTKKAQRQSGPAPR